MKQRNKSNNLFPIVVSFLAGVLLTALILTNYQNQPTYQQPQNYYYPTMGQNMMGGNMMNSQRPNIQRADCSSYTDEQLEEFGDQIMGIMLGSEESHEQMDEMMGGEGSESLRLMHIRMALNMGCTNLPQEYQGQSPQGMMGSGGMM